MRLIDADKAISDYAHYGINHSYDACDLEDILTECSTIEAIEKADYEARLKADMSAMLTELKNELTDISWNIDMYDDDLDFECCYLNDIDEVIQQKINSLSQIR